MVGTCILWTKSVVLLLLPGLSIWREVKIVEGGWYGGVPWACFVAIFYFKIA